jgi:DNA-binding XRE family transcriptional regulator
MSTTAVRTRARNTGLRARREEAGLAREKLSRLANCSLSTIVQLEGVQPSPAMAKRIADVFGCEPADLFGDR